MKKRLLAAISTLVVMCAVGSTEVLAQAPSDAQTVQIAQTANQIGLQQAKLALQQSKSPQVKDGTDQMIADHTSVDKSVAVLAEKLDVTARESETSKQLSQEAAGDAKRMKCLGGTAFG